MSLAEWEDSDTVSASDRALGLLQSLIPLATQPPMLGCHHGRLPLPAAPGLLQSAIAA